VVRALRERGAREDGSWQNSLHTSNLVPLPTFLPSGCVPFCAEVSTYGNIAGVVHRLLATKIVDEILEPRSGPRRMT